MSQKKINVLVVDDNSFVCFAIKESLNKTTFINSMHILNSAVDFESEIKERNIDLAIIDSNIIDINKQRIIGKNIKIVALTSIKENINDIKFYSNEIDGIVNKSNDLNTLSLVLELVMDGFQCIPKNGFSYKDDKVELLTKREREVLRYIAKGMSNKEISSTINISDKTVSVHRFNIMYKTGINNIVDLLKLGNSLCNKEEVLS